MQSGVFICVEWGFCLCRVGFLFVWSGVFVYVEQSFCLCGVGFLFV